MYMKVLQPCSLGGEMIGCLSLIFHHLYYIIFLLRICVAFGIRENNRRFELVFTKGKRKDYILSPSFLSRAHDGTW